MNGRTAAAALACLLLARSMTGSLTAAEQIDSEMNWRIRREATENSQVMRWIHYLADLYGPRLTGSPNFTAACQWAVEQMGRWGMENAHLEKWDFGHPGWGNDDCSVSVVSPYKARLNAQAVAWTPGTKGKIRAEAVQIKPPEKTSQEDLAAYLDNVRDKVRGKIVLTGAHAEIPIAFNPTAKRREDSEVRAQYDPLNPVQPAPPRPADQPADAPRPLDPREIDEKINAFLVANGALVRVIDAARNHGQIAVFANRTYDASKAVPGIVIRNEDYGRISRTLADGAPVEMEIHIASTIYEEQSSLNAVAEITGSDKNDEVVIVGAHIDSWHAGTGATDNAAGAAVMMEAARILQRLGVRPRRTIRVALWGGEEQGLLGSKAYVQEHFGTFEAPKPEFQKLAAYINIDSGTGRVRGASVFGPEEAAAVLREILESFEDLGVMGAISNKERSYGGTDSTSFRWAGLPAINLSQDPIEYGTHTWHSDLDTYERVLEGDLKQCVIVVASLAYHLAMRDEMLPRFGADKMPGQGK
jgi:hypothetical protein